jgi:holin-like protein
MIPGLLVLLLCQLAGEFVVRALDAPIPGPIAGMVLLFILLGVRRPAPKSPVVHAADGLLDHLQLLFIPAGVGVIQYLPMLAAQRLPIVAGLVVSWFAVLVATAVAGAGTLVVQTRWKRARGAGGKGAA